MKHEARLLLEKACDSLLLSVEMFNRPHDRGRVSTTLMLLDHAFEMLLKASVLHRGGRIRERREKQTIGFDACVRKALSDGEIRFLNQDQALTLQTINGLRDAAQHHLIDISEGQLYLHAQSGLTLFRDLLKEVFDKKLSEYLPNRVLPVSTLPPTSLSALFDDEITEIKKMLRPGRRRRVEAYARLRPLAILDSTIRGEKGQPGISDLRKLGEQLTEGRNWETLFAGVAAVNLSASGTGPEVNLRLTKKKGIPVELVPKGTPGASVVAVKRVDELGFYNLGAKQLAEKVGMTMPKTVAVVDHLGIRGNLEYYKEFRIGKSLFKRYSPKAADAIRSALKKESIDSIWAKYRKQISRAER